MKEKFVHWDTTHTKKTTQKLKKKNFGKEKIKVMEIIHRNALLFFFTQKVGLKNTFSH